MPQPPHAVPGKPSPLRVHRFLAGLTQAQLAKKASVAPESISHLENGTEPRLSTAKKLAAALGVGVEVLFPDHEPAGTNGNGA